ncbi:MAG TPA: UvrD-helicase domain-containing protein [Verrucomicrobiae bacterium]|nr:UvrD-helicase domain-containing protein [Verrucomicrobiae bacterium]
MEPASIPVDLLTPSQRQAVNARGNVLVMAGAGTGKTKTLVERCLDCLARERVSLDELLIVTFTEAAAAEMRQRLRRELEKKAASEPADDHWSRQLVLFDLAHIGTLHSFCLKLIREHFYELGLDPQLAILDEGEARQRANETLDEQFQAHYEGTDDFSIAVRNLIRVHGGGRDENIRKLILRLHHYSQTRPDAAGWLARQRQTFSTDEPMEWQHWLPVAIADWKNEWLPLLEIVQSENEKAGELARILSRLPGNFSRPIAAEILRDVAAADLTASYPKGQAGKLRPALGKIFEEANFLASLATVKDGRDPLMEDWTWVRGHMESLLQLAQEFTEQFSERKRMDGVVDFHDLEQFALKLLWDFTADKPTAVAEGWRKKLSFVFVDEYQDINAAQDKIIAALAGDGAAANRFLVGDVKQSIYRFRLADPGIFRDHAKNWRGESGQTVSLSENFRSHEGLLQFVNSVCRLVMREEVGGVVYDAGAELKSGATKTLTVPVAAPVSAPRVELLLRLKPGRNEAREEEDGDLADLDEAQKEARLVAGRLQQLITDKHSIWDDHAKVIRPAEWRDIAILLRSPRGKSEIFAKEFERAGIPLAVARGGFYESAEILDLLSLLELLDNPLQDVPCIAVLRSPLVGLSLDELAEIRLGLKDGHFWTALVRSQDPAVRRDNSTASKVTKFLERFPRWRKLAKQSSLSECLEAVLTETLYADWLRAQPRGTQRAANVTGFLSLAQQFDQFQRQGLYRFLKFIEAQKEANVEPEISTSITENAVRLMSIHQSKGLEFPVVVLADLAKNFNTRDLTGEIIFDEFFGLCPKVKPPGSGRRYPSLPHWLAERRQQRELRGEELRLLYVALTRARDNLILTANLTADKWEKTWNEPQPVSTRQIAGAKSFADWLALWFRNQKSKSTSLIEGEFENLRWRLAGNEALAEKTEAGAVKMEAEMSAPDKKAAEKLQAMLAWNYPFAAATERKAKSSVTQLRREAEESDDEAQTLFLETSFDPPASGRKTKRGETKLSASEIGAAHHKFLQHVRLETLDDPAMEAERLAKEKYLTADELEALDLDALAAFWNSPRGKKIKANAANVRRELPFTARFSPAELADITGRSAEAGLENEFIVIQGVADLIVLLPEEIWLIDFKTDGIGRGDLPEKIRTYTPQLKLYGAALEKIFGRKVTLRALHFLSLQRTEVV